MWQFEFNLEEVFFISIEYGRTVDK
jgi:hypothetical protein